MLVVLAPVEEEACLAVLCHATSHGAFTPMPNMTRKNCWRISLITRLENISSLLDEETLVSTELLIQGTPDPGQQELA